MTNSTHANGHLKRRHHTCTSKLAAKLSKSGDVVTDECQPELANPQEPKPRFGAAGGRSDVGGSDSQHEPADRPRAFTMTDSTHSNDHLKESDHFGEPLAARLGKGGNVEAGEGPEASETEPGAQRRTEGQPASGTGEADRARASTNQAELIGEPKSLEGTGRRSATHPNGSDDTRRDRLKAKPAQPSASRTPHALTHARASVKGAKIRTRSRPGCRTHSSVVAAEAGTWAGFSRDQLRKLTRELDERHVQTRDFDGKRLSYIEGWYAIAQANAIFGHAGWDREMVHFERVMERTKSDATVTCGYMARVRIRVRAGSFLVIREGTGWGSASAGSATIANERALKAAETDATKRALSTFGASFGLSLYDKDRPPANQRPTFTLFAPDGRALADSLSGEGYCSGFRQLIEICKDTYHVNQLSRHNRASLADLRVYVPSLRNSQGVHFADLLLKLIQRRRDQLGVGASSGRSNSAGDGNMGEGDHVPTEAVGTREGLANRRSQGLQTSNLRRPLASGEAIQRYTGQSSHRRIPYPFQSRSEVTVASRPWADGATAVHHGVTATPERNPTSGATAVDGVPRGLTPPPTIQPPTNQVQSVGAVVAPPIAIAQSGDVPSTAAGDRSAQPTTSATDVMPAAAVEPNQKVMEGAIALSERSSATPEGGGNSATSVSAQVETTPPETPTSPSRIAPGLRIDKSKLWLGLERRIRDKRHLKRVGELPCVICNRQPSHAHHLRFAQRRGMSQKVSDEFVVPLCALHHGDLHRSSSEQEWWARQSIDPLPISVELWRNNRG